ncbi:MAG: ATP-binding cassette domain-containing protein [Deltaproteobacteria bacterium]|nr:ATP-binding cassette domain-containing protein [Deltaproteobacteria bacterium]
MTVPALLELDRVTKRLRDGARAELVAVDQVSLAILPGECHRIVGASGAGKSTLLSLAVGLVQPTEGEITFRGEVFSRARESHRSEVRRRFMGSMLQQLGLIASMSVRENLLAAERMVRAPRRDELAAYTELLQAFDLTPLLEARVQTLSGGERQRVAIVRALVGSERALFVLDEPTAHLDDKHTETLIALLSESMARGCSVIVATHDGRLSRLGTSRVLAQGRLDK